MLIARDVDGNTTANINGRSFDVQIDRQARARAAALCGMAGLCSTGSAFAAGCGSRATASPCSCKHAAACCIHAASVALRHTMVRLISFACVAVPLYVRLWFVGFVTISCSLPAILAPVFSWYSCKSGRCCPRAGAPAQCWAGRAQRGERGPGQPHAALHWPGPPGGHSGRRRLEGMGLGSGLPLTSLTPNPPARMPSRSAASKGVGAAALHTCNLMLRSTGQGDAQVL